jgi:hypothetical protein
MCYLLGMSKNTTLTAKAEAPVTPVTAHTIAFTDSVKKVASGKTFTVNAPKGITINGTRYESGTSAPIVNVKIGGWSVPMESVRDIIRDIATALSTIKGLGDALTESAPSVTRGYRHEDRVAVIRAVVASGKTVTAESLINAVNAAKESRATSTTTATNAVATMSDIDDTFTALGL